MGLCNGLSSPGPAMGYFGPFSSAAHLRAHIRYPSPAKQVRLAVHSNPILSRFFSSAAAAAARHFQISPTGREPPQRSGSAERREMSYMRGDLLTKMRKMVKGLARPEPRWLKAMEEAPPVTFPRPEAKIKKIEFPEDEYVLKFNKKHPDSLYHDAIKISGFDPPPARVFAWRILELKEQGVSEDVAMAVADMEYRTQKKAKKKAYKELKEICRSEGKKPPPNPYPSAIKEIQAEEIKYVMDRHFNPKVIEIANKMKEERDKLRQDRAAGQW